MSVADRVDFIDRAGAALERRYDRVHKNVNPDDLPELLQFSGRQQRQSGQDRQRLVMARRAQDFLREAMTGRRHPIWRSANGTVAIGIAEAMTTSDFPLLMGDILDRQLLGVYSESPSTWMNYIQRRTTRDFRTNRLLAVDGLEGRLFPQYAKPERTEPQEDALSETGYTWAVDVYEKSASISWQQIINDDLDAFTDIPRRFARGARRTEEFFAADLIADSNGPEATFYTAGNNNIVTGNPPLDEAALETAWGVLFDQTDAEGEPIDIQAVELVVPPALEITANQIMETMERVITVGDGERRIRGNGLPRDLRVSVNHYLSFVATTNGDTSWFLFANPDEGRPAAVLGFLRGFEEPGIYRKTANTERVGGGAVSELGDFDTNENRLKVMHVLGGTLVDPKVTVASNGSGA